MKLDLGAGENRYREGYETADIDPANKPDHIVDLTQPLPWEDNSVEAVNLSHVLEHLEDKEGLKLMQEIARILQPGGIVEVTTPDFNAACQLFLGMPETERWSADLLGMFFGRWALSPFQGHKTGYSAYRLGVLFKMVGLKPELLAPIHQGDTSYPSAYGRAVKPST